MRDFSEMLSDLLAEAEAPYDPVAAGRMAKGSTDESRAAMMKMTAALKKLRVVASKQMEVMNGDLQALLTEVKKQLGVVHTQFKGLMHMTDEQQAHIGEITKQANTKIAELKKITEPLEKLAVKGGKGGDIGASIVARVNELEQSLQDKEMEMEGQRMEYEDVLDYYEGIMTKMKKAQLEAERHLHDMEVSMGMDDWTAPEPVVTEAVVAKPKKKKKKKVADMQNYGTFDLNEHLAKAREKLPKTRHDW